ncbi:uncharacterized protein PHALS_01639 [Plasmopara halstedii]|uniref:Uncharacterized protein n=1 Tax=Plasmopara halstedii TaxID=4781 RepID=A0A0P1AUG9_PLAHL|nr:uncharacterized protein PHALS_01639 [Plasmopara halstedii]CEG45335.1 hypothetical protein PHALS_01639 [Plasmopara halstedii]|eukprot:XP_024581704.1 hypothetical protein PHALS_01639 [Plasmopara halstedii]
MYRAISAWPVADSASLDFQLMLPSTMFPSREVQAAAELSAIIDLSLMVFAQGIYRPSENLSSLGPLMPPSVLSIPVSALE